jgi:hypothetical protein
MRARFYYIAGGHAPAPQERAAAAVLRHVAPALGIGVHQRWMKRSAAARRMEHPNVTFYAPDGGRASLRRDRSCLGMASASGEILIRATLPPGHVAYTAAHEARHVWQFARGWDMDDREAIERDANRYARRTLHRDADELRAAGVPSPKKWLRRWTVTRLLSPNNDAPRS